MPDGNQYRGFRRRTLAETLFCTESSRLPLFPTGRCAMLSRLIALLCSTLLLVGCCCRAVSLSNLSRPSTMPTLTATSVQPLEHTKAPTSTPGSTSTSGALPRATLAPGLTPLPTSTPFQVVVATPTQAPTSMRMPTSTLVPKPDDGRESELKAISLINQERQKRGLSGLVPDDRVMAAARAHSQDMAVNDFMDHTGSDGSKAGDRLSLQGYRWTFYGENVACGYPSPAKVVQGWMASHGHRNNILHDQAVHIGLGLVYSSNTACGYHWTVLFAAGG